MVWRQGVRCSRYRDFYTPGPLRRIFCYAIQPCTNLRPAARRPWHADTGHAVHECKAPLTRHVTDRLGKTMARVGEAFPLLCPNCVGDISLIAFITDPRHVRKFSVTRGGRSSRRRFRQPADRQRTRASSRNRMTTSRSRPTSCPRSISTRFDGRRNQPPASRTRGRGAPMVKIDPDRGNWERFSLSRSGLEEPRTA